MVTICGQRLSPWLGLLLLLLPVGMGLHAARTLRRCSFQGRSRGAAFLQSQAG
jgi:hypothetical protein